MKYMSTRGQERGLSFEQVLFSGYAKDQGLYMPEHIPLLSSEQINELSNLGYVDVVKKIMSMYISPEEIPTADLEALIERGFSTRFQNYPQVVTVAKLADDLNIAELFHGPTYTFKDLGLSVLGQLYEYFLKKKEKHLTAIVGTTGDTGSAAISAVRGLEMVDIVVLMPKGMITPFQERQMTTVIEDNVHNYRVSGTCDELDVPIKQVFGDWSFVKKHNLCSINSINWGRILVQICHHVYLYFQLCKNVGEDVELVIPTGGAGNLTSAVIAHAMGLPLKFVAALSPNDIIYRILTHGDYSLDPSQVLQTSWASAIDVLVPLNIERILLVALMKLKHKDDDPANEVAKIMSVYDEKHAVQLDEDIVKALKEIVVDTLCYKNEDILNTVKQCQEKSGGYKVCPHTAVAAKYHYDHPTSTPRVCIATASPKKFPEALKEAGVAPVTSPEVDELMNKPTKSAEMAKGEDWEQILRQKIIEISKRWEEKKQ